MAAARKKRLTVKCSKAFSWPISPGNEAIWLWSSWPRVNFGKTQNVAHVKLCQRFQTADLSWKGDQAVVVELQKKSSERTRATRQRRRTFNLVSCVMASTPAGISGKALA